MACIADRQCRIMNLQHLEHIRSLTTTHSAPVGHGWSIVARDTPQSARRMARQLLASIDWLVA
jgi:hypothetical protein